MTLAYCINCDSKNKYTLNSYHITCKIRGRNIQYEEIKARCVKCGSEVYVGYINDQNVRAREHAYFSLGEKTIE